MKITAKVSLYFLAWLARETILQSGSALHQWKPWIAFLKVCFFSVTAILPRPPTRYRFQWHHSIEIRSEYYLHLQCNKGVLLGTLQKRTVSHKAINTNHSLNVFWQYFELLRKSYLRYQLPVSRIPAIASWRLSSGIVGKKAFYDKKGWSPVNFLFKNAPSKYTF